jgi:hypothetical protein
MKEEDLLEELGVDGRIILELIFEKLCKNMWIGFVWLRIGTNSGLM